MELDRRDILLGAGLALTLSGCQDRNTANRSVTQPQVGDDRASADWLAFRGVEPDWNLGDDPWRKYEQEVEDETTAPTVTFAADYIAVLHLEISLTPSLQLKSWRAHFPTDGTKPIWDRVIEVIKYLNKIETTGKRPHYVPETHVVKGIKGFGFTRPHHFIIYIKNPGISYDPNYPIWFGGRLIEKYDDSYLAKPNRSFFNAKPPRSDSRIPDGAESDRFLYIQNYFYTADEGPDERIPSNRRQIQGEKLKYSVNINAAIMTSDGLSIPLVIDPDTGNMGGGGEGALPPP